jgi:hypothetical protein
MAGGALAAAAPAGSPSGRPLDPLMRAALYLGTLLVFLAGVQLFVLTKMTDRLFAWTIDAAPTAAFLGAFYWTSVPLALGSARQRTWDRARVGVPGVLVFLWLTLATTLIHVDKFHFDSPDFLPKTAAWVWVLIYALDPILISVALVRQLRRPGEDPPHRAPVGAVYLVAVGASATIVLAVGIGLFATPRWAAGWWPWPLTPLTARAMASWLIGLGIVLGTAILERDWLRIRFATVAYAVLGVLELIALARYAEEIDWDSPVAWALVAFFAGAVVIGTFGWVRSIRKSSSLDPTESISPTS